MTVALLTMNHDTIVARVGSALLGLLLTSAVAQEIPSAGSPIAIAPVARDEPVDFQSEVLPFLKDNCLACHNQTRPKADLVLETPQTILKGGDSGPGVIPGNAAESLLLRASAHQLDDLIMPPRDNKVAAVNLTPAQLGLLKLWIDQGAKGEVRSSGPVQWQAIPDSFHPIYAVAVTPDGRLAACSRANRISVYHLPSATLIGTLADPALMQTGRYQQPTAHADFVYGLAFSHDATTLASGAYREIKLWQRPAPSTQFRFVNNRAFRALAASPDGQWIALAGDQPSILLWNATHTQEVRLISGHDQALTTLSFSPDGSRLMSASQDLTLRIWSIPEGDQLFLTNLAATASSAVWLTPTQVAVGAEDHHIGLWSLPETPEQPINLLRELKGHTGPVTALAVREGQLLSGSADGTLRFWNTETGETARSVEHGGPILAIALSPDGLRFASAGDNRAVKLWEASENKLIAEWKGDWRARQARTDRERVVQLASREIDHQKADIKTGGDELAKAEERLKKAVEALAKAEKEFEENGSALAVARQTKTDNEQTLVKLQQQLDEATKTAADLAQAQTTAKNELEAAQAQTAPDENLLLERRSALETAAKAEEEARQKAAQLGEEFKAQETKLKEQTADADKEITKREKQTEQLKLARDNSNTEQDLASKAVDTDKARLEQLQEALALAETKKTQADSLLETARHQEETTVQPIRCLTFSPDNRLLVTGGDHQTVFTYSAQTGDPYDSVDLKEGALTALSFLSPGRLAAASSDGAAQILDIHQPWTLHQMLGSGDASSPIIDRVNALVFSPDDQVLASGGGEPSRGGEILLWEMPTGRLAQAWKQTHSDSVFSLAFSPDGQYLGSAAADRFIRVSALSSGQMIKAFEGHTHHVLGLSWKADGRTLASAGADNVVKVWNFNTGERKKNIEGFSKEVTSVHFVSTTDQAIASCGDKKVRLIDESGKTIRQFEGSPDFVYASAVTADGKIVVAGGQDGVLRVWDLASGKRLAELSEVGP